MMNPAPESNKKPVWQTSPVARLIACRDACTSQENFKEAMDTILTDDVEKKKKFIEIIKKQKNKDDESNKELNNLIKDLKTQEEELKKTDINSENLTALQEKIKNTETQIEKKMKLKKLHEKYLIYRIAQEFKLIKNKNGLDEIDESEWNKLKSAYETLKEKKDLFSVCFQSIDSQDNLTEKDMSALFQKTFLSMYAQLETEAAPTVPQCAAMRDGGGSLVLPNQVEAEFHPVSLGAWAVDFKQPENNKDIPPAALFAAACWMKNLAIHAQKQENPKSTSYTLGASTGCVIKPEDWDLAKQKAGITPQDEWLIQVTLDQPKITMQENKEKKENQGNILKI